MPCRVGGWLADASEGASCPFKPLANAQTRAQNAVAGRTILAASNATSPITFLDEGYLMKGLIKEFREFAMRGNMIDLAVGVVIGAAFSGIIKSFVENIIMPPLNLLTYSVGVNFANLAWTVEGEGPKLDDAGKVMRDENGEMIKQVGEIVILKYGPFLEAVVNFLIIAAAVFIAIKVFNTTKSRFEDKPTDEPAEVPEDIALLKEIRDALQSRTA